MVRLSVVKGERSETAKNLEALNVARQLCVHTITLCKSEKNFPKRNRWLLTQPIVEQSVKAYTHMRKANAIKVVTWDDYKLRRAHQIKDPQNEPQKHCAGASQNEASGNQGDERPHPMAICLAELPKLAGQRPQRQHAIRRA